ncbi:MAG TPA: hypothetical protein VGK67_04465 [Myxococcales bacterium]|jgi:hypothetical protein
MAPVRVTLASAPSAIQWPRYCGCCLLALDEPAKPGRDGLAVPWCEDCQRHASMHKVERFARWARWASWGLFASLLALAASPVLRGRPKWLTYGAAGAFLFLALGLMAVLKLKLEDRKESCAAAGPPVRLVAKAAGATEVECDNADFALLLAEGNPGSKTSTSAAG